MRAINDKAIPEQLVMARQKTSRKRVESEQKLAKVAIAEAEANARKAQADREAHASASIARLWRKRWLGSECRTGAVTSDRAGTAPASRWKDCCQPVDLAYRRPADGHLRVHPDSLPQRRQVMRSGRPASGRCR